MTEDDKALVERIEAQACHRKSEDWCGCPLCEVLGHSRDRIEQLTAEVERLRLDVEAQEALQVSAYRAGVQFGWNCGFTNANDRYQEAMQGTEHIAELRRIRKARAALEAKQ